VKQLLVVVLHLYEIDEQFPVLLNINYYNLYQKHYLHEMIIEYYHLVSIQMDFVIKNLQQLKQVDKHLIDGENHLHLLLNPNQRELFFI
jgi:hypothetical protein